MLQDRGYARLRVCKTEGMQDFRDPVYDIETSDKKFNALTLHLI